MNLLNLPPIVALELLGSPIRPHRRARYNWCRDGMLATCTITKDERAKRNKKRKAVHKAKMRNKR